MSSHIKTALKKRSNPARAEVHQRFFKTGKGEYGEGDIFLGVPVPDQRKIAKEFSDTGLRDIQDLLSSKIHEHRLTALLILVIKFNKSDELLGSRIYDLYLKNTKHINNWDLVDSSADKILGAYLFDKDRSLLFDLADSENIWERRIAMMATFHFIKNNQFNDTLNLAGVLLNDTHDLIHKAVGWMLREVGKRDRRTEERFLKAHYKTMPRTMLRYAIEKFDKETRKFYLRK